MGTFHSVEERVAGSSRAPDHLTSRSGTGRTLSLSAGCTEELAFPLSLSQAAAIELNSLKVISYPRKAQRTSTKVPL